MSSTDAPTSPRTDPGEWLRDTARIARDTYRVAHARDNGPVCRQIQGMAGRLTGRATVAVVGERSRGKSRLINAIAQRPGLLPVDQDVTTNAYVAVLPALDGDEHAVVTFADPDRAPQRIGLEELAGYVSEAENPGNDLDVRNVAVYVRLPRDRGLELLDTPGVGGLVGAHADMALAAVAEADGLLMVLQADKQITDPEIEFLSRAAEAADRIVIALNQVDNYTGDRGELISYVRSALADRSPELERSPIVPVSAQTAETALKTREADPDLARELTEQSGLLDLMAALRKHVVGEVRRRQGAAMLSQTGTALDELARPDRELVAAVDGVSDPEARLQQVRRALAEMPPKIAPVLNEAFKPRVAKRLRELTNARADVREEMRRQIQHNWSSSLPRELPRLCEDAIGAVWQSVCADLERDAGIIVAAARHRFRLELSQTETGDLILRPGERLPDDVVPCGTVEPAARDGKWDSWIRIGILAMVNWATLGYTYRDHKRQLKRADQNEAQAWVDRSLQRARHLDADLNARAKELGAWAHELLDAPYKARLASLRSTEVALAALDQGGEGSARKRLDELAPLRDRLVELSDSEPAAS